MSHPRALRLTMKVTFSVMAAAAVVIAAVFLGLTLRFIWLIDVEDTVTVNRELLVEYLKAHVTGTLWLLPICLTVFGLAGVYTRGRSYLGHYKVPVITQGLTTSYLIFAY